MSLLYYRPAGGMSTAPGGMQKNSGKIQSYFLHLVFTEDRKETVLA